MTPAQLSSAYAASLVRVGSRHWPGVLLHSTSLSWPFDPHIRPLDSVAEVRVMALRAGLNPVTDPFAADLPRAAPPWLFHLPTTRDTAKLESSAGVVDLGWKPTVGADWWSAAVLAAGCRLLIAACIKLPGPAPLRSRAIAEAASGGRVFGAHISVQF